MKTGNKKSKSKVKDMSEEFPKARTVGRISSMRSELLFLLNLKGKLAIQQNEIDKRIWDLSKEIDASEIYVNKD